MSLCPLFSVRRKKKAALLRACRVGCRPLYTAISGKDLACGASFLGQAVSTATGGKSFRGVPGIGMDTVSGKGITRSLKPGLLLRKTGGRIGMCDYTKRSRSPRKAPWGLGFYQYPWDDFQIPGRQTPPSSNRRNIAAQRDDRLIKE